MDLAVFSEIYIYCKYLKPGQSLSVSMGQRGEMGQTKKGTIGIFHGLRGLDRTGWSTWRSERREQKGQASVEIEHSRTSHILVRRIQPWVLVKIVKYQGLSEDRKVSGSAEDRFYIYFIQKGLRSDRIVLYHLYSFSSYYLFYYFQYSKCKYIHQSIRNLSLYFH